MGRGTRLALTDGCGRCQRRRQARGGRRRRKEERSARERMVGDRILYRLFDSGLVGSMAAELQRSDGVERTFMSRGEALDL